MCSIIYRKQRKKVRSTRVESAIFFLPLQTVVLDDILILHFQQGSAPTFSCFFSIFSFLFVFLSNYQFNITKYHSISFDILKYLSKFSLVFTLKPPVYGYKYIEFREFKNI